MAKSEVYSWRVSPETKAALEDAARRHGQTVGALLQRIVRDWLDAAQGSRGGDEAEQARLHAAAKASFGAIRGGDPDRSARARETIRTRLTKRRAS